MGCNNDKNVKSDDAPLKIRPKEKEAKKALEAKVVLLGDPNVGKSSIAQRFCKNIFSNQHIATIGGAYLQQKVLLDTGETMKLHIWDTGGQERFRAMANLYYKGAAAANHICYICNLYSKKNQTFYNLLMSHIRKTHYKYR